MTCKYKTSTLCPSIHVTCVLVFVQLFFYYDNELLERFYTQVLKLFGSLSTFHQEQSLNKNY